MTDDKAPTERSFLRRWSQRKLAASREATPAASTVAPAGGTTPAPAVTHVPPTPAAFSSTTPAPASVPELPPVESLTFDSDFSAFLQPSVDPGTRQAALRKLFSDPRFNVMDGLDVYIDDYNKFEPIPPELVQKLAHARYLFDPPKTRVTAQGYVEDVPVEEAAVAAAAEHAETRGADTVASSQGADEPAGGVADAAADTSKDSRGSDA